MTDMEGLICGENMQFRHDYNTNIQCFYVTFRLHTRATNRNVIIDNFNSCFCCLCFKMTSNRTIIDIQSKTIKMFGKWKLTCITLFLVNFVKSFPLHKYWRNDWQGGIDLWWEHAIHASSSHKSNKPIIDNVESFVF